MKLPANCYYCERVFTKAKLCPGELLGEEFIIRTKDHVIPTSKGGINQPINYVYCCERCNKLKADRTPDEFLIYIGALLDKKIPKFKPAYLRTVQKNTEKLIFDIAPLREMLYKKGKRDYSKIKSTVRSQIPLWHRHLLK